MVVVVKVECLGVEREDEKGECERGGWKCRVSGFGFVGWEGKEEVEVSGA